MKSLTDASPEHTALRPSARPENWSFIVASNDEHVLQNSLLRSPGLTDVREVIVERGHRCAGAAYNQGMAKATGDIVVFVHQDVFLPAEWISSFSRALAFLEKSDPNWGVLGGWGITPDGHGIGHIYSTGLQQTLGKAFEPPSEVSTLDEVLLVLRRSSGLRFDEYLPGFHLYGTDICLQARRRGMKNYAISAFCIHNSNGIRWLPLAFWKSFFYVRRKWRDELPVYSPCMRITRSGWPFARYYSWKVKEVVLRTSKTGRRCECPDKLYEEIAGANSQLTVGKAKF
jgi:glycosyltransferase involved in cell wall biosynthesis